MLKKELRKIYLANQKNLTEAENHRKSQQISEQFFKNFDLSDVRYLHLFMSIAEKGEINTSFIFKNLWKTRPEIKTIVPRVNFEKDVLEHLEVDSKSTITISSWGIPEPVGDEFIDEKKIDLVLVPMLVFDERGFRVGYGKGFYDKFLSLCRKKCVKVGVCFFEPIKLIEDIHKFDIKLDHCITPDRIYNFINN